MSYVLDADGWNMCNKYKSVKDRSISKTSDTSCAKLGHELQLS
jgi:hypothetical protein